MSKKIKVRPGKTQSKAGFVIGIIFCLIGLFAVVPIFGPFGLVWTGMAAWITYSNYRNGFTDKPIADRVIEIESETQSVEERLKKLQSLYQQEVITKEEYEKKRQEILDEI